MKKINFFGTSPAFGIDLGTTNSCIAVIGNGNKPEIVRLEAQITMPSCVMWKGGENFVVGSEAYKRRGETNVIYSVKRLMGSSEKIKLIYEGKTEYFEPWKISCEIIKALVSKAKLGIYKDITDVVITVPAYFTNTQIEDTKRAGQEAGLHILNIMKEPTAAALLYNQEFNLIEAKRVLLYDLGGGTFDASLVLISPEKDSDLDDVYDLSMGQDKTLFSVLKVLGDTKLGGDDVDNVLAQIMTTRLLGQGINQGDISNLDREKILLKAENFKKMGVGSYRETIKLNGKQAELIVTRDDFVKAFDLVYKKTKILLDKIVTDPVVGGKIDQIITVGGSTKSELIQQNLKQDYPQITINVSMNPDESVALGAAIQAKRIKFGDDSVKILDCLAMNIGVLSEGYIKPLLRAGEQIPCSNFSSFLTMEKGQSQVELEVYQGLTRFPEECTRLGMLNIDELKTPEDKYARVIITLSIDSNGLLSIEAETLDKGLVKLPLLNINGVTEKVTEDKKVVRWRHFAETLKDENKKQKFLQHINDYQVGNIEESDMILIIQESKVSVGEYQTNIHIGETEVEV